MLTCRARTLLGGSLGWCPAVRLAEGLCGTHVGGGEWLVGVLLEALHRHAHQGTPLGKADGAFWGRGLLVQGGIFHVRGQKQFGGVAVGKGTVG